MAAPVSFSRWFGAAQTASQPDSTCGASRRSTVSPSRRHSLRPRTRHLARRRRGGFFLQVQGPRLLKNYAVWAGDENRILLYDATGERFGEIQLSEGPDPMSLKA
jgi:hypothetical protein